MNEVQIDSHEHLDEVLLMIENLNDYSEWDKVEIVKTPDGRFRVSFIWLDDQLELPLE